MTRKTLTSIFLVLVFIAAIIWATIAVKKHPIQQIPVDQPKIAAIETPVVINEETSQYLIEVEYPQFSDVSQEFNDSIKRAATLDIEDFKKNTVIDQQARLDTATTPEDRAYLLANPWQYGYQANYTVVQNNDLYISVLMHQSGFNGGAHGYDIIHTFNYDRTQDQIMTIADMFPNNPNYLETLSKTARAKLKIAYADYYTDEMAIPGTEPDELNFSQFTFVRDMVTIYFQQYQVGPYVIGQPTIEVPRS
jgi:heme/copper-type cytochrome/quinol oxidase subunit 2